MPKWSTTLSAGSKEDLTDLINKYHYSNGNIIISEDGTVTNTMTGKVLSLMVREYRGRWQYGKFN